MFTNVCCVLINEMTVVSMSFMLLLERLCDIVRGNPWNLGQSESSLRGPQSSGGHRVFINTKTRSREFSLWPAETWS